jgi:hypothetical protein
MSNGTTETFIRQYVIPNCRMAISDVDNFDFVRRRNGTMHHIILLPEPIHSVDAI